MSNKPSEASSENNLPTGLSTESSVTPEANMSEKLSKFLTILFACTHNAGRSYAAETIASHLKTENIKVISAGTSPKDQVNPLVKKALSELGYFPLDHVPSLLDKIKVETSDIVITMGCDETCPIYPGKVYLEWDLQDPADQDYSTVISIVSEIEFKVKELLNNIKDDGLWTSLNRS
jgi:protein-tyrosine-phosphatase